MTGLAPLIAPATVVKAPPAALPLPPLGHLRARFTLRSVGRAFLPPYKGSTLRGAFGQALRSMACAMDRRQACKACALAPVCVYTQVFETFFQQPAGDRLRGVHTAPRPFVLEPRDGRARQLEPGEPLAFDLLLFGRAAVLGPYALRAVERMARRGLGRRRFPFAVAGAEVEQADGSWLPAADQWAWHGGLPLPAAGLGGGSCILSFETPTRLCARGEVVSRPSWRLLVVRMARRLLELSATQGLTADEGMVQQLLRRAEGITAHWQGHRWWDLWRFSNRQGRKIPMGGFVGRLRLEGDLEPLAPLLRATELLHLGKGTTLGLGKVSLRARAPRQAGC